MTHSRRGRFVRFFIQLDEPRHEANEPGHSDTEDGLRQTVAGMSPWVLAVTQQDNRAHESRNFCATAKVAGMTNCHGDQYSEAYNPFSAQKHASSKRPANK